MESSPKSKELLDKSAHDQAAAGRIDTLTDSTEATTEPEQLQYQHNGKVNYIYIVWAVIGSLLHCMSTFVKGIESADPWLAKFTLSLANFFLGINMLFICKLRRGENFRWPWL